jgi:RNA-binding protein
VNTADKKKLRAEAHTLKPVVMIGQSGLTAAVLAELNIALNTHELLKVRIRAERDERKLIIEQICTEAGAELIQTIGQIAVIYRLNPNK